MTVEEIRELVAIVNETGVAELEVQRGENRVRIRRQMLPAPAEFVVAAPAAPMVQQVAAPPPPHPLPLNVASAPPSSETTSPPVVESQNTLVKSPIVGTFYESASPGAPAFVRVGDHVKPGQVLCIIESMKLMNEIEAEEEGIIVAKLVENGRPVEYGEALFALSPR
ncbi:MAG TPA: acetyl-CoA carboxylase biotin carboxyl carrier protein [Bryobacteraceae bacterium]|nr:acetyl-CoA carboxylase biotin carboxyl carrier protein [Bryobacteraceae bacterium]